MSRIDPEDAVVDYQNVECGDISAELDESPLAEHDYGSADKVLVSIRYVFSSLVLCRYMRVFPYPAIGPNLGPNSASFWCL